MRDLVIIGLAFAGAVAFMAFVAASYILPAYFRVKAKEAAYIAHKRKALGK